MSGIRVENVVKSFGKTPALRGVTIDIRDGEFMVLLGPSGCGKTTLLRTVAGLEHIDSGRILIGDRDVTHLPPRERDIAMVFQSYAVFPHMTVAQNIGFGLRMHRRPPAEIVTRVRDGAELLGLVPFLDRYPAQLSGGQRQRVAVARAIVMDAPVLLMDEPLSNLDALLRLQARADLKRLHQEVKRTTIYVTHDQVEAMSMGDRIAVMRDGEIIQLGRPMEIYDRPATQFVGSFIGSPPMNFLRGSFEGGSFVGQGFRLPFPKPAGVDDRPLLLGVRAEHFTLGSGQVPARVAVVEPLGAHTLLTAMVGTTPVKVQVPIDTRVQPDQDIQLGVDPALLRWMDEGTGAALRP